MNILYVTGITPPIEAVLKGEDGIQGLPPFYYPWKMLVDRGKIVPKSGMEDGEKSCVYF